MLQRKCSFRCSEHAEGRLNDHLGHERYGGTGDVACNRSAVYPSQFRHGIVEKVSRKNGGRCYICNRPIAPGDLSIDHVVPCAKTFNEYEYRYPQSERNDSYNDIGNLMPVHKQRNSSKGSAGAHYESRKIKSAVTPYHKTNGIGDWQKSIAERNAYKERELKKELGKYNFHDFRL